MILLIGFLLVFTRIAAAIFVAPLLGNRSVPFYVRFLLALLISICVYPTVLQASVASEVPGASGNLYDTVELAEGVFGEAIKGSLIGFGVLVIYSAAMMIGSAIGQMSGLQLDSLAHTSSEFGQQPTSVLIGIVAAATFVLVGGPELIVSTVIDSFLAIPVNHSVSSTSILGLLTNLLHQSFELTIRAIAPAIATLLIATVVVGFLSRTMPQLNLIQVGLSSNMAIMITAILLTLGGCVWLVIDNVEQSSFSMIQSLEAISKQVANE